MNCLNSKYFIKGVSLVELMVSMAISLVLMLAITNVYIGSKETYRVREDFSVLQELGRQVLESITSSIQMADHWGGVSATNVATTSISTLIGAGTCNAAWILDLSQPVFGQEGATTQAAMTSIGGCFSANSYQPNSDVLILRYGEGEVITDADVNNSNIYLRSQVDLGADIFTSTVANSSIASAGAARNHLYKVEAYFLRNCSDTACSDNIPGLWRLTLNGTTLQAELLADGVEQLQFTYGIDTDADTVADQVLSASAVTDWSRVVSINLDMLIRSPRQDHSVSDTTTYQLAGGASATGGIDFTPSSDDQAYHRKQLQKLIQIRNRIRI